MDSNIIRRSCRALTILEMLVSTAMLSLIVLGLTAVFVQVQKAFKEGLKQADVSDAGRTVLDMIGSDLRQMSDAQQPGVVNLYWDYNANASINYENGQPFRTNQLGSIFILEHTNNWWTGVAYAISNQITGGIQLGTLYRYSKPMNEATTANELFTPFSNEVYNVDFSTNWHLVAEGIVHLKLRAFDQNGNDIYYNNEFNNAFTYFSYPTPTNTLPTSVELELAVLSPTALTQTRALSGNPAALNTYFNSAAEQMEVFRQRITIPVVPR